MLICLGLNSMKWVSVWIIIVMGILIGAFGARLKVSTFMTNSATQLIKQIGLVLYLAGLGLSTGGHFADTLLNGDGLLWLGLGAIITVGPILISGAINIFILKKGYAETAGMLCGSVANPFALDYAVDITESRNCSVAYATVYPVIMFLRIISAQILLILFLCTQASKPHAHCGAFASLMMMPTF